MKVAIVQEQIDVRRGGAETSTLEMARHLAKLGLDVTVVCSASDETPHRPSSEQAPQQSDEGLRFHFIDVGSGSRLRKAVRFVSAADQFCRQEGFDIVHAVTPCFSCNIYQPRGGTYVETVNRSVARAAGPLGRLIKRIGRRFNRRQRFLLLAEREILGGHNRPFVACVSEYVRRQVTTAFPDYGLDFLQVIYNGVDIEPLSPGAAQARRSAVRREIGVDETAPLVLFVAHNFKLKGLAELIRAVAASNRAPRFEKVGHPELEPAARATGRHSDAATQRRSDEGAGGANWVLVVVGRDSPARYRRLARRLGIAGRVRFAGPQDDLRGLYAAADVLAHPTWYDPCSRVVLEALSCGLPVVTTCFNGAAELIEDGRHGVVIASPRDTATLTAALATCLKPELRTACRADAPRLCKRLSMARHARELKTLYKEVAGSKT